MKGCGYLDETFGGQEAPFYYVCVQNLALWNLIAYLKATAIQKQ